METKVAEVKGPFTSVFTIPFGQHQWLNSPSEKTTNRGGTDRFSLERITDLVRDGGNGLTGRIGTLAEGVARVGGARADIAIAEILPGGIEILPRVIGGSIAGGQAQHGCK